MTPQRWAQIGEIFGEAIGQPESERQSYISRACTGDPGMGSEVRALLQRHEQPAAFLNRPIAAAAGLRSFAQNAYVPRAFVDLASPDSLEKGAWEKSTRPPTRSSVA
jgi:hypothetical protein